MLLLCGACLLLSFAQVSARTVIDQTGEKMEVPDAPKRVLALAPSLTEMIYSLDAGGKLVGATQFSNYPEAAKNLPRVGSYIQLDIERIVALGPDLCFATKDGNPKHAVDTLKSLGIPVYAVDPRTIEEILHTLRILGDLLGAEDRAEALVGSLAHRIERVRKRVASVPQRPGVFFQIAENPIFSAGKNSFIDRLIVLAGGNNLAGNLEGYPRFSWENILVLQPEVVLISTMADGQTAEQLKAMWQRWPEIPAVRQGRLHVVNADFFNRPTARLIDGLEILADLLHPLTKGADGGK